MENIHRGSAMSTTVTFRFLEASSWIGRIIAWRLNEPWSHVVIIIDDDVFSAQIPFVAMYTPDNKDVDIPPRKGVDLQVTCTVAEAAAMKHWCGSQVGNWYDLKSILGWMLGLKWLQSKDRSYCFEFCRKPLVALGWLNPTEDLVKGSRLLKEIEDLIARKAAEASPESPPAQA
jgi:hypothetical protein